MSIFPSRPLLPLYLLICVFCMGCRDDRDETTSEQTDTAQSCNRSSECPSGYGCLVYKHECIPLTNHRQCLHDHDCTDEQICVRYAPAKDEADTTSTYCAFTCNNSQTNECIEKGVMRKCSTETNELNYNDSSDAFCGQIPSTCRNGRLDPGELCDLDIDGHVLFSTDNPDCKLWQPMGSFKPGGIPGCAKTCIGYSKGSGQTKCVYAQEPNDVNGFDTCLASLYIDQDTYTAYATVNYATTNIGNLDNVEGYILCGQAENVNLKILTDEDKLPQASTEIAPCASDTCTSRTLSMSRDLSEVTSAIGKDEGQCVVYLRLSGNKLGIICDLTYKDNPAENMPPTGTMPSAAIDNPNACVTIAGTEDDFDIYEAFLANINCLLSQYPYVSYTPPQGDSPDTGDAMLLAIWDIFPNFITEAGYPIKAAAGLALLQSGLPAEDGVCVTDAICRNAMLSLQVVGSTGFQKSTVTQTAGTQGLFETLQIGGSKNDWATEKPVAPYEATHLSLTITGLEKFRDRKLTLKGSLKKGQLLITYTDGNTESILAEDVSMPSLDPQCQQSETEDTESDIPGCPDENGEGTLTFAVPDEATVTEFRVYVYGLGSENLNLNSIWVSGISNVIY